MAKESVELRVAKALYGHVNIVSIGPMFRDDADWFWRNLGRKERVAERAHAAHLVQLLERYDLKVVPK
jgi:hypothetical protein